MNKFLISLCLVANFSLAQAQTAPSAASNPNFKDDSFEQKKKIALQAITGREEIMTQEKVCATNSKNIDQLKSCFNKANTNRKAMIEDLKTQRDQIKK